MSTELKMKRCKECGRWFQPTSNKQKYCEEKHYRPCPVCGKLIYAKYLSDPARCCSGVCKSALGKLHKEGKKGDYEGKKTVIDESSAEAATQEAVRKYVEDDVTALKEVAATNVETKRYTGEAVNGWEPEHVYDVQIVHKDKQHVVKAVLDKTTNKSLAAENIEYVFTNKRKISTIFKAVK